MSPDRWQQIEGLFQAAMDLEPNARAEFLSAKCEADVELYAAVNKLIQSADSAEDFIESPVWTDSSFLDTSAKRQISDSLNGDETAAGEDNYIGREIGVYRLTKEIGRGGMGAVYLAERADGEFFQRVAIKLIKRGMDSDFIIRRFRHERQILASFEHPFIARLLDGGTTNAGVPYFVMEYVPGETLYTYSDKKRLGLTDRLKLFQKVCSAIEYAHSKQIIHRDIKPSNILINSSGSPKLLDFGIAKILDPNLIHESINPTASMLRMMTPDYASPEQVQGFDVAPASDIYSLGILLYELLTGHRPYNFAGRALHEVTYVICNTMPKPPSRIIGSSENLLAAYSDPGVNYLESRNTTLHQLSADLAKNIDDIVMKALSKEPGARYLSVAELSKDITRHLSGTRIEAPKFTPPRVNGADPLLRVPENSKALAVLPFAFLNLGSAEDTDDRFLGVGLADALITRLSKVRKFVVRPTSSILSFGEGHIDPVRAGSELNVDYILDGSIKKSNNRLRVTVQLLDVAENAAIWATSIDEVLSDVFTLEDTLANKVIEVLLPQLTSNERELFDKRGTENPEAFEHYLRGRYHFNTFTEEGFAKAFVSFHTAIAADPNYSRAYSGIADYYNWLGILGVLPPQECFLPAIEAAKKAVELDPELSEANASLGFSLHAGNYEWSRAEHHLLRAIELNPSNAIAYTWFSIVLYTEGRFAEGLQYAERAVEIDPLTPFNHHNVGWGLYYARRFREAEERYKKVIADFPSYSFGFYGLSKIHRILGETGLAIRENDKAMQLMDNSIFSLLAEAECYAADHQFNAAMDKLAYLEEQSKVRHVSPYQMALVYCYLNDKEKALKYLEKACEIKEAWLNWMGVDPVFDLVRGDERFQDILEKIGYRPFFNSVASTLAHEPAERGDLHNLTTLVINEGDVTEDTINLPNAVRPKWHLMAAAAGLVLVLSIIAVGLFSSGWFRSASPAAIAPAIFQNPSIVILPFKSSDPENENLGIGLADALTHKLGNIKSIQVISANTGRALAVADPIGTAATHGITFVLQGDLSKNGDSAVLSAKLINTRNKAVIWAEDFSAPKGDHFRLQTMLAEKVWTSLGINPLPLERQQVEKSYTQKAEAYNLYLIGRYQMTGRSVKGLKSAIDTFSASIKHDPNFAPAYVGLADTLALLNLYSVDPPDDAYAKARQNVTRALEIDPNLAEAHANLAYIKFFHERDYAGSELEFRRAIQVNPSFAQAHHWFALTLAARGETVDAVTEIETAKRLDPRSAAIKSAAGVVHFQTDSFEKAIEESNAALALDERTIPAHKVKRWAYTALGDRLSAEESLRSEIAYVGGEITDPGWQVIAIQIEAINGDKAELLKRLERAVSDRSVGRNPFGFGFEVALAYNALGQTAKALDWLERSEAAGGHSFNFLKVEPRIANLRGEPRFLALAAKLSNTEN
jgi:serine/threonine protein kinase/tetratricopeptide (TPR) repeat protein